MKNKRQFEREMDDLARRYFGMTIKKLIEQGPPRRASSATGSDRSKGMSKMAQAVGSKMMKRQICCTFSRWLGVALDAFSAFVASV